MSLFIIALRLEWAVFSKKKARVPDFQKYPDRIVHFFVQKCVMYKLQCWPSKVILKSFAKQKHETLSFLFKQKKQMCRQDSKFKEKKAQF